VITVRIGARRLQVGAHALERYQERVRPALDGDALLADLSRVLLHAELMRVAPAWVGGDERAEEWVVLGDAIAFPVRGGVVATCLTRSQPGEANREKMNRGRQERARRRVQPGVRKKNGPVARDERRRVRARKEARD
jgi:hypothetical protein